MRFASTKTFFKLLLSTALFVIFAGPVLLISLIFLVYRTWILIVLKLKFGSKFGSLIGGLDAYFLADTSFRNIINIVMIVRTPNGFQEFFRKFKQILDTKIFQNKRKFSKFLSTHHKVCGYHYIIPNRVEMNECVKSFNFKSENEEMTKEELLKEISNYSNQPLPYNNTCFWEMLLCEKPVTWNNRIDKVQKSYAVLLRFHHGLGDGVSLLKLLLNLFSESYGEKVVKTLPTQKNTLDNLKGQVRSTLDFIFILLISPIVLISQIFFRHVETTSMDVPFLSDQQILVAKVEESGECVKIIKALKRKVENTLFIDILSVAISKSFSSYFQKKGKDPNLTCLNTFFTILMKDASYLQTETKTIKLKNTISYFNINIPIVYKTTLPSSYWKSFMDTLEKIKIETKYAKSSPDYKVTYLIFRAVAYIFPDTIAVRLATPSYLPLIVTNIPGSSAITLYDDTFIEDIVGWVPRVKPIGLSLAFLSYDNRLQIGLNVDKVIISDERDAQDIVDGIYQALIEIDGKI